jgi:hypothetical protein
MSKTTYSLKVSQNILADTVFVKVIFDRGDNLVYDSTIDARLIDREWVSSLGTSQAQMALTGSPLFYLTFSNTKPALDRTGTIAATSGLMRGGEESFYR